jgi:hypothetical protein
MQSLMWSPPENEPRRGRAQSLKVMHLVVAILGLFVVGLPGYFLARESGNPLYFAGALAAVVVSQILIAWGFARAARKL